MDFSVCPFFTVNRLARTMNKLAEEKFSLLGLSLTYAYLIMIVKENPDITSSDLSNRLYIAPSTCTRFIDKLVTKKLVYRKSIGKLMCINLTEEGQQMNENIILCWQQLNHEVRDILGTDETNHLAALMDGVSTQLSEI
jgi:DNA-binding MarR family transcriptional regulator